MAESKEQAKGMSVELMLVLLEGWENRGLAQWCSTMTKLGFHNLVDEVMWERRGLPR
mgnify:CR=1 FL=1